MGNSNAKAIWLIVWECFVFLIGTAVPNICVIYWIRNRLPESTLSILMSLPSEIIKLLGSAPYPWWAMLIIGIIGFVIWAFLIICAYYIVCALVGWLLNPIIMLLDRITFARHVIVSIAFVATVLIGVLCSNGLIELEQVKLEQMHLVCFIMLVVEGALAMKWGDFEENFVYESGSHFEITFDDDGNGSAREVTDYAGGDEWIHNTAKFLLCVIVVLLGGTIVSIVFLIKLAKLIKKYIS